jgi:hypothetical protein
MGRKNETFHHRVPPEVQETARRMRHRITYGQG